MSSRPTSSRNTLARSLHDTGLAAWFGGALMGAIGLNGAAAQAKDPTERLRLSSIGWARWTPAVVAAVGAHTVGSIGLLAGNAERLEEQQEARTNTAVKTVLTLAAAGVTLYSGILGTKIAKHADHGAPGTTEPSGSAPDELASAQSQQKVLQWVVPALTGVLVVLGAQQGEQQRPLAGRLKGR